MPRSTLMIASAARLPGPECEIFVAQLGGAMARVEPAATAFVGRDAHYIMNVHGRWSDARDDERVRAWARRVFQDCGAARHRQRLRQLPDRGRSRARRRELRRELPRLQAVKQRFDPDNLFRMNLNIAPAVASTDEAFAMSRTSTHAAARISGADAGRAAGATNARSRASRAGARAPTRSLRRRCRRRPRFVMAHVLQAYLLACSRDPRARRDRRARCWRAPPRCRPTSASALHLAAIAAVLDDDYERAKARLGELLRAHPRDVLALQVAHAFDYVTGDTARMRDRVAAVLPAWSSDLPGYHAVLAMHAFGLEECGEYERAEQAARAALALNPLDARAHHVMAHVFEMTERADAGVRWMNEHIARLGRRHRRRHALLVAPGAVPPGARASPIARWRCTTSASAPAAPARSPT